jgi:TRAP-type C4-dicarboxylate transport system permease large subunit
VILGPFVSNVSVAMAKKYDEVEEMAKVFIPFFKDASLLCNLPAAASFTAKVTPLLLPVMEQMGVHPVHFGMFFLFNILFGLLTPPFGMVIFSALSVSKATLKGLLRELVPFLIADVVLLAIVTFIPEVSLFLPRLFGLIK